MDISRCPWLLFRMAEWTHSIIYIYITLLIIDAHATLFAIYLIAFRAFFPDSFNSIHYILFHSAVSNFPLFFYYFYSFLTSVQNENETLLIQMFKYHALMCGKKDNITYSATQTRNILLVSGLLCSPPLRALLHYYFILMG